MTDMNAAYIVVLGKSKREDLDETLQLLRHINGVISVKPITEDIPQHIAEAKIANNIAEKINEAILSLCSLNTSLAGRINQDKDHREFNLKMFEEHKKSSSTAYVNRFKNLLDKFVYSDEKELNDKQKELRIILKEFCGEYLCSWGGPYLVPEWDDINGKEE